MTPRKVSSHNQCEDGGGKSRKQSLPRRCGEFSIPWRVLAVVSMMGLVAFLLRMPGRQLPLEQGGVIVDPILDAGNSHEVFSLSRYQSCENHLLPSQGTAQLPSTLRIYYAGYYEGFPRYGDVTLQFFPKALYAWMNVSFIRVYSLQEADFLCTNIFTSRGTLVSLFSNARSLGVFSYFGSDENTAWKYYAQHADFYVDRVDFATGMPPLKHDSYRHPVPGARYNESCGCSIDVHESDANEWLRRPGGVVYISTHADTIRTQLVEAFNVSAVLGKVICPSKSYHNTEWPIDSSTGKELSKVHYVRQFKFIITPENSLAVGYTTEKLPQAVKAGAVPIYWGDGELSVYNSKRMLLFVNGSNPMEVVAAAERLVLDSSAREEFFQEPVLVAGAESRVTERCNDDMRAFLRAWKRHRYRLSQRCTTSTGRLNGSRPASVGSFATEAERDAYRARGCRVGVAECCD